MRTSALSEVVKRVIRSTLKLNSLRTLYTSKKKKKKKKMKTEDISNKQIKKTEGDKLFSTRMEACELSKVETTHAETNGRGMWIQENLMKLCEDLPFILLEELNILTPETLRVMDRRPIQLTRQHFSLIHVPAAHFSNFSRECCVKSLQILCILLISELL